MANTATGFEPVNLDRAYNDPDVEREDKLQPSLQVLIQTMEETSLKAKVKVHPGYEYGQDIKVVGWKE